LNLETAVECARQRQWRAHSALTRQVNVIEAAEACIHTGLPKVESGQLPLLG